MKIIKFRVWNRRQKCFMDLDTHKFGVRLTSSGFEVSTGYDGLDRPTFGIDDSEGYRSITDEKFKEIQENYVMSQFTGLKDKNDKEIYEGDIVRNQANAKRHIRRTRYGEYKLFCGEHGSSFYKGWVEGTWWEVVGNIYENKELLK